MNIKVWQQRLRDFAAARDWQSFHTPKNLAMALMVEAGELLELFQWLTTAESHTLTQGDADKERVGDEIADVLLYLLQLADHTGVDVEEAMERKVHKNARKHPAKHPEKSAPMAKMHVLVDWENVQPKGEELRKLAPEGTDVWLFHGPQQRVDASSHRLAYGTDEVTLVRRSGAGRNALDFQLSYYIGYITARQPEGRFVVVSNDTGYDPMLEHARELGFDAQRREFRRAPTMPAIPVARNTKAKPKAVPPPAVILPRPVPSAAQIAWRGIRRLRQTSGEPQPEDLPAFLEPLIQEPVPDKALLVRRAAELMQIQMQIRMQSRFQVEDAPQAPSSEPATKPPAPAKKAAIKKASPTAAQIVQRVLASLRKMPDNKPMRSSGLLKHIETHVTTAPDKAVLARQVLALLQERKEVALSADGLRVSYPGLK